MDNVVPLSEKIQKKRAELDKEGKLNLASKPPRQFDAAPGRSPERSFMAPQNNIQLDAIVDGLDIVTAYNKFSGKGIVLPGNRTEGIKVRCPNPAHVDNHPSAWISTDKQVWKCGACDLGGDKFDIAAWYFGMPVPGYKSGKNFPELRERIAASLGYAVTKEKNVVTVEKKIETGPDGVTLELGPPEAIEEVATITDIRAIFDSLEDITLEWEPLCKPKSFLDIYMREATIDDVPEEYHFWNGLLAISMAIGRDATLRDLRPVFGNLFICILGRTGSGKSKAKYILDSLLHQALPYSATDPHSKGVLRTNAPASAEALIWAFQKRVASETDGKDSPEKLYPVRGLVDYSELSSLIGRTSRSGNVLIPTLMQFYDAEVTVSTISRTHGTETAQEPYACAITTSQPKSLKGLLTMGDAASGFLNRWVFIAGREKKKIALGGNAPNIEPAILPLQRIQAWASDAKEIEWSQEASNEFTQFFHEQLTPIITADETDLLSRLDLLAKKLVLLFTANEMHKTVQASSVDKMKLIIPYILECYGIPGAQVGNTLQEEIRTDILKCIVSFTDRKGRGPSSRDINQTIKKKKYPLDVYTRTLKHMVDIEEIVATTMVPESGRGRPTTRYTVGSPEETKEMIRTLGGKRREAEAAEA